MTENHTHTAYRLITKAKQTIREQNGFSLPELLVSSVIMVTILTILTSVFYVGVRSYTFTTTESYTQLDTRLQVNGIREQIRDSKTAVLNGQSYPYYDAKNQQLVLFTGSAFQPKTVMYTKQQDQLIRRVQGQADVVILSAVQTFAVTIDATGNTDIQIQLTTSSGSYGQTIPTSISLQALPRGNLSTN